MKIYNKTKQQDWFTVETVELDEKYTQEDIHDFMTPDMKETIQYLIDKDEHKKISQEVEAPAEKKQQLESVLSEKLGEKINNLIGASFTEVEEGRFSGVINVRVGVNHEQIRF